MPRAAARPCAEPGCPQLVQRGRCEAHTRAQYQRRNAEARANDPERHRFYGSPRWKRIRAAARRRDPLCQRCRTEGRVVVADDVHHRDGDWRNNAVENLEPICRRHHNEETHGAEA